MPNEIVKLIKKYIADGREARRQRIDLEESMLRHPIWPRKFMTILVESHKRLRQKMLDEVGFDAYEGKVVRRVTPPRGQEDALLQSFTETYFELVSIDQSLADGALAYQDAIDRGETLTEGCKQFVRAAWKARRNLPNAALELAKNEVNEELPSEDALLALTAVVHDKISLHKNIRLKKTLSAEAPDSADVRDLLIEKLPSAVTVAWHAAKEEAETIAERLQSLPNRASREIESELGLEESHNLLGVKAKNALKLAFPEDNRAQLAEFSAKEAAAELLGELITEASLTEREKEVIFLKLDDDEATNEIIAFAMGVVPGTVFSFNARIKQKMHDARDRLALKKS
jgi:hypothetical protein